MKAKIQAQAWIDAIYSAFSLAPGPEKKKLVDMSYLVGCRPKTVGQRISVTSAAVLSNFGGAFEKVVKVKLNEQRQDNQR